MKYTFSRSGVPKIGATTAMAVYSGRFESFAGSPEKIEKSGATKKVIVIGAQHSKEVLGFRLTRLFIRVVEHCGGMVRFFK